MSCVFSKRGVDCGWRYVERRTDRVRADQILQKEAKKQKSQETEMKLEAIEPKTEASEINRSRIVSPFSGGCACGAIRYEATAEPMMMLHCHCRDCQQSSGGPFSSFVVVPKEAFKLLQGSLLRFHASPSERGGQNQRGFCADCGSPILAKPDANPHIVAIRTASLDDPSWFNPQIDVWTSDAQPWDQMNPALPKLEKYAPQTE